MRTVECACGEEEALAADEAIPLGLAFIPLDQAEWLGLRARIGQQKITNLHERPAGTATAVLDNQETANAR